MTRWPIPILVLSTLLAAGCEQTRGVAAVSQALSERYQDDAFEVSARDRGESTTVEITLEDPAGGAPEGNVRDRAREVGRIAVDRYPLTGVHDSVVVRLRRTVRAGAVDTRTTTTQAFSAADLHALERAEDAGG